MARHARTVGLYSDFFSCAWDASVFADIEVPAGLVRKCETPGLLLGMDDDDLVLDMTRSPKK
jgi:hypothetical protein